MGHTKWELQSPSRNHRAKLFQSLGHPARLAIMEYLMRHKECTGMELRQQTGLTQPTFAQHIARLVRSSLIQSSYQGNQLFYKINLSNLNHLNQEMVFFSRLI